MNAASNVPHKSTTIFPIHTCFFSIANDVKTIGRLSFDLVAKIGGK